MQIVSIKKCLAASATSVWKIVCEGDGIDRWLPAIASCRLEGTGPGARRFCTTGQGQQLEETIEAVDHTNRIFQYRIDRQDMMPTTNVRGTLCVSADGAGQAEVLWFVNYDLLDPSASDAVRAGILELYTAGLAGLERLGRELT